jgi:hypothetical protein
MLTSTNIWNKYSVLVVPTISPNPTVVRVVIIKYKEAI